LGYTWVYETGYQVSANKAFEELQAQIFEESNYAKPWDGNRHGHATALIATFEELGLYEDLLVEMSAQQKGDTFDRLRDGVPPRDRVEAVLWSGRTGTKSILDAEEVEPMQRVEVTELFGHPHPEAALLREQESMLHAVASPVAQFVVGYEDGFPCALFFFGRTGGQEPPLLA